MSRWRDPQLQKNENESGFRPPLCTYRLNWARRTSWGWWDDWDDTVLQTQDSKFEPWRSEAEHATSRSRRLPTILTFTRGWGRNNFCFFQTAETGNRTPDSGVKGSGANHYPRAPALHNFKWVKTIQIWQNAGQRFRHVLMPRFILIIQYCREPPWPRGSVLGLRPPGLEFRILCLEGSVTSFISPSSGGSPEPVWHIWSEILINEILINEYNRDHIHCAVQWVISGANIKRPGGKNGGNEKMGDNGEESCNSVWWTLKHDQR